MINASKDELEQIGYETGFYVLELLEYIKNLIKY